MKKILIFIPITGILFLLSSCTTVYIPNEINAPGFCRPNQIKAGISVANSGTNLQAGYSFSKKIAAIGDISYLDKKGNEPRFQRQWGLGLGYFTRIGKEDSMYYEIFGGYSMATTNSSYEDSELTNGPGYENADYYRFFVTNNISVLQEFFDIIISVRLSYYNFTRYESHEIINPEKPVGLGIEPALKIRMGSEYFKIKFQVGYNLINNIKGPVFNYTRGFGLVGIDLSF